MGCPEHMSMETMPQRSYRIPIHLDSSSIPFQRRQPYIKWCLPLLAVPKRLGALLLASNSFSHANSSTALLFWFLQLAMSSWSLRTQHKQLLLCKLGRIVCPNGPPRMPCTYLINRSVAQHLKCPKNTSRAQAGIYPSLTSQHLAECLEPLQFSISVCWTNDRICKISYSPVLLNLWCVYSLPRDTLKPELDLVGPG